jgi:hypothetical protein
MVDLEKAKPIRNWWKVGFFVMLFLFEFAREWAVLSTYAPPKFSVSKHIGRVETLVSATGRWRRTDGGSALIPGAVRITCWEDRGVCHEISYNIFNGYAGTPDMSTFEAKFTGDRVTYENDVPACARYQVTIDLNVERAFALRERKSDTVDSGCRSLERRVEMELGDGWDTNSPTKGHFVPLFSIVRAGFEFFD